jgi:hypothetical protein
MRSPFGKGHQKRRPDTPKPKKQRNKNRVKWKHWQKSMDKVDGSHKN